MVRAGFGTAVQYISCSVYKILKFHFIQVAFWLSIVGWKRVQEIQIFNKSIFLQMNLISHVMVYLIFYTHMFQHFSRTCSISTCSPAKLSVSFPTGIISDCLGLYLTIETFAKVKQKYIYLQKVGFDFMC